MASIGILVTIAVSVISLCESKAVTKIQPGDWAKVNESEYPKIMKYLFKMNKLEVDDKYKPTITGAEYKFVSGKKYKVSLRWDQHPEGDKCPEGWNVTFQVQWREDDAPVFVSSGCQKA